MNLIKNIQFQQLLNLTLLTLLAYSNNLLYPSLFTVLSLILFAIAFEAILNYLVDKKIFIPYSAAITAFGIILMLGWSRWYIPYILIALSLFQKKFLKIDGYHIFNPSNFALIAALLIFFPKAMPIIGQLGKDIITLYIVIILGVFILIRVNRWLISLSFFISFFILSYALFKNLDPYWQIDEFILKFYSTSFIVYIFFMLTDPRTTPNALKYQALFGFLVALCAVLLDFFTGEHLKNIFISLFFVSALCAVCSHPITNKKLYFLILAVTSIISILLVNQPSKYFIIN